MVEKSGCARQVLAMSTVQEIKQAIEQLPQKDFWELSEWVIRRHEDAWDRQVNEDAVAGRLDFLFEEAEAERKAGKLRDWPLPSGE
jgi:hypothetical protein